MNWQCGLWLIVGLVTVFCGRRLSLDVLLLLVLCLSLGLVTLWFLPVIVNLLIILILLLVSEYLLLTRVWWHRSHVVVRVRLRMFRIGIFGARVYLLLIWRLVILCGHLWVFWRGCRLMGWLRLVLFGRLSRLVLVRDGA